MELSFKGSFQNLKIKRQATIFWTEKTYYVTQRKEELTNSSQGIAALDVLILNGDCSSCSALATKFCDTELTWLVMNEKLSKKTKQSYKSNV